MRVVTCKECKGKVRKDEAIYEKPSYYHADCYELKQNRAALMNYICDLMGLKAPGPKIYSQRKRIIQLHNYTDKELLLTLKFMYEVKKMDVKKANCGIALIPEFHDEAIEFFNKQENQQKAIARLMEEAIKQDQKRKTIVVKDTSNNNTNINLIDPNQWWESEDD